MSARKSTIPCLDIRFVIIMKLAVEVFDVANISFLL